LAIDKQDASKLTAHVGRPLRRFWARARELKALRMETVEKRIVKFFGGKNLEYLGLDEDSKLTMAMQTSLRHEKRQVGARG
jgi:hypothetical protein